MSLNELRFFERILWFLHAFFWLYWDPAPSMENFQQLQSGLHLFVQGDYLRLWPDWSWKVTGLRFSTALVCKSSVSGCWETMNQPYICKDPYDVWYL